MKDRCVEILQKFLSHCIDIEFLKIIHGFKYILRTKIQIKKCRINTVIPPDDGPGKVRNM